MKLHYSHGVESARMTIYYTLQLYHVTDDYEYHHRRLFNTGW